MPTLQTSSSRNDSIGVSLDSASAFAEREEWAPGGKWEDDEERRFFEDLTDLKDYVPRTILGIEIDEEKDQSKADDGDEEAQKRQMEEEVKKLEAEVAKLAVGGGAGPTVVSRSEADVDAEADDGADDDVTPVPTPPRTPSPQPTTGPGQLLTALLAKMPDVTHRESIDQMAIDFAFLNSKASRKRLVKVREKTPRIFSTTRSKRSFFCVVPHPGAQASHGPDALLCPACRHLEQVYARHCHRPHRLCRLSLPKLGRNI